MLIIASLWFVPICWCNFRLFQIIACTFSAELRSIKLLFTLSKGSSRHSPDSSAGWARFSIYFPTRCLPCLFSFIFSFRSQWILLFWCLQYWKNRCLGESPSPKRIFGGAAKFAGFSLASPTMLGVTARSAVNHCGVPNTSFGNINHENKWVAIVIRA